MPLTVAIVDSHSLLRDGVAALLSTVTGITVVASTDTSDGSIEALRSLKFKVALIGVTDSNDSCLETAMRLVRQKNRPRLVLMNQHAETRPNALIQIGVASFLTHRCGLDELVKALRLSSIGQRYIAPALAQAWSLNYDAESASSDCFADLSLREIEVMRYLLADKRISEIAHELCLSAKTVATYRSRLMEKLGVRSDIALLRLAQMAGFCS